MIECSCTCARVPKKGSSVEAQYALSRHDLLRCECQSTNVQLRRRRRDLPFTMAFPNMSFPLIVADEGARMDFATTQGELLIEPYLK